MAVETGIPVYGGRSGAPGSAAFFQNSASAVDLAVPIVVDGVSTVRRSRISAALKDAGVSAVDL